MLASHATAYSPHAIRRGGLSCVRGTRSGRVSLRGALARSAGPVRLPYAPRPGIALAGSGAPARGRLAEGRDARCGRTGRRASGSMLTACGKGTMTREKYVTKRLAMLQARITELEQAASMALASRLASMANGAGQATNEAGQADFTKP